MPNGNEFNAVYQQIGKRYDINPNLLKAIARVESDERADAVSEANAVGLMQVLCSGAENDDELCRNRFNINPWPIKMGDLKDPWTNANLAAQILDWNLRQFGFPKALAVYNAWSARHDPANGPFHNQAYVDKVRGEFDQLGNGPVRASQRTVGA